MYTSSPAASYADLSSLKTSIPGQGSLRYRVNCSWSLKQGQCYLLVLELGREIGIFGCFSMSLVFTGEGRWKGLGYMCFRSCRDLVVKYLDYTPKLLRACSDTTVPFRWLIQMTVSFRFKKV